MQRFTVSSSAGQRDGKPWAVVDRQDRQGGRGMRRVAFFKTPREAQADAKRRNEEGGEGDDDGHRRDV